MLRLHHLPTGHRRYRIAGYRWGYHRLHAVSGFRWASSGQVRTYRAALSVSRTVLHLTAGADSRSGRWYYQRR